MSMSSRIRADDAGPGSEDRVRSAPEPADEQNVETASDSPETAEAPARSPDAPARDNGEEGEKPPVTEPDQNGRDQKRIDQLTRERYEARRERDEARAQLAQWQRQQQRQEPPSAEREAEDRAYNRMQQERLQQDFDRDCNTLWQKGVEEYGDGMSEAKRGLDAVGWGNRPDELEAVTALPDGHRIYRELGGDLDNAARILSLPPMRMAVELARMSRSDALSDADGGVRRTLDRGANREPTEDRRSRAPEPLRPVGGNSRRAELPLDHPNMTIAEHIRRRDREQWGSSRIRR